MKNRQFICNCEGGPCPSQGPRDSKIGTRMLFTAVVFVILLSATALPLQNPYVRSPAGSISRPVSQTRQGLFRSPSRYDTGGNRLVVGNVRGGKHFRADVPYQSTTSFSESVPSAELSSFLRYSAGEEGFKREAGRYKRTLPYYNPSQTVTFTKPGRPGVFTSSSASAIKSVSSGSGAVGGLAQTTHPSTRVLADGAASVSDIRSRPMSRSMEEMERLISAEVGGLPGGEGLTTEGVEPRAERISDRAADLKIKPVGQEEIRQRSGLAGRPYAEETAAMEDRVVMPFGREQIPSKRQVEVESETDVPVKSTQESPGVGGEQQDLFDTYKQVRQQIDNLQETLKQLKADKAASETSAIKSVWQARETAGAEKKSGQLDIRYPGIDTQLQSFRRNIERLASGRGQAEELSGGDISTQAKRILGGKSLASFSEDKFNEYIRAAELYQEQGRHYRAVSAYTLASIYNPDDARAYAGKGHALFAAGEYMSSALYLSRAIEISPEYAAAKVNLLDILATDDKEKLDSRIAEAEEWLHRSDNTAELQFLLGYIYYQVGKLDKAKEMIDVAYIKMPGSPAVDALRKAIDENINLP